MFASHTPPMLLISHVVQAVVIHMWSSSATLSSTGAQSYTETWTQNGVRLSLSRSQTLATPPSPSRSMTMTLGPLTTLWAEAPSISHLTWTECKPVVLHCVSFHPVSLIRQLKVFFPSLSIWKTKLSSLPPSSPSLLPSLPPSLPPSLLPSLSFSQCPHSWCWSRRPSCNSAWRDSRLHPNLPADYRGRGSRVRHHSTQLQGTLWCEHLNSSYLGLNTVI